MDEAMREQALNFIMGLLLIVMLAIGLFSMLIGKLVSWWDAFWAWRQGDGVKSYGDAPTPPASRVENPPTPVMSRKKAGITSPIPLSVSVSDTDTATFDLAAVPSDLTYEEVVAILAGQVTPAGKPAYSGKKIYGLVGGNYNEFTALMRRLRAKDDAPAEPPETTTPIAGRPTRAAFRETDLELQFPPPS